MGMGVMSNAQKEHVPTDNSIPSTSCECFTFVDDCSGKELDLTGSVTLSCDEIWDGKPWSRDYTIVDGKVCIKKAMSDCKGPSLCLNSGNWEVCDITGCTVRVFQTLSNFPRINGDLIGYGWSVPSTGGIGACVGRIYAGGLNNIHGRDDLYICPGDPVELNYTGLSIPDDSGLCLFVDIKETNGTVIASQKYDSDDVTGSIVDLTSLFADPDVGQGIYIIDFRLTCCDSESPTCSVNTFKTAYIEIHGAFGYSPQVSAGFVPNNTFFTPTSDFPGTQLPNDVPAPPLLLNQLNLFGNNVNASEDISIDWSLDVVNCTNGAVLSNINSQSVDVEAGDDSFSTGANLLIGNASACTCYRMTMTYFDRCEDDEVTDTYFFKNGPNCPDFQTPDDDTKLRSSKGSNFNIKVVPNPIQSDLSFTIDANLVGKAGKLQIQNTSGQIIQVESFNELSEVMMVSFDSPKGVYFYEMQVGNEKFSGKFVKM